MNSEFLDWLAIGIILLNAYSLGASCVERFVNYQSWPLISRSHFSLYHRAQQPFILGFIVMPLAFSFVLQLLFCFFKPPVVSWMIALGLLIPSICGILSTVFLQIPIHRQLDAAYSPELVARLLHTDWIRKAADGVRIAATIALLWKLIRH